MTHFSDGHSGTLRRDRDRSQLSGLREVPTGHPQAGVQRPRGPDETAHRRTRDSRQDTGEVCIYLSHMRFSFSSPRGRSTIDLKLWMAVRTHYCCART